MKRVVAALLVLLSLPLFGIARPFLLSALKLHWGQPFYAPSREAYGEYGMIWVGLALLVLVPSALVLLKKKAPGSWLVLPLLVFLLAAVALPSNTPPGSRGRMAVRALEQRVERASESLKVWAGERQQFPGDDRELQSAIEPGTSTRWESTYTQYERGGQPVPYRFVLVANSQGPHRPQQAGDQPAIVYCAVSPDRQRFWLTATALPDDVSSEVMMLEREGQLVVIIGKVPPKPPEPISAAPEKKPGKNDSRAK